MLHRSGVIAARKCLRYSVFGVTGKAAYSISVYSYGITGLAGPAEPELPSRRKPMRRRLPMMSVLL